MTTSKKLSLQVYNTNLIWLMWAFDKKPLQAAAH